MASILSRGGGGGWVKAWTKMCQCWFNQLICTLQATSHFYLNCSWTRPITPYGVTKPQYVQSQIDLIITLQGDFEKGNQTGISNYMRALYMFTYIWETFIDLFSYVICLQVCLSWKSHYGDKTTERSVQWFCMTFVTDQDSCISNRHNNPFLKPVSCKLFFIDH